MSQTKINVGMIDASSIGDAKVLQGIGAWNSPSAGALTFINTSDLSSVASYEFTAFDSSSYDGYVIETMNLIPATDAVQLILTTSSDGGSSYDTGASDYEWRAQLDSTNANDDAHTSMQINGVSTNGYSQFGSSAGEEGGNITLKIMGPHLAKETNFVWWGYFVTEYNGAYGRVLHGGGHRRSSADVDGIKLAFSSGNIESGTITAYGYANA